jgi:hypothetical protein
LRLLGRHAEVHAVGTYAGITVVSAVLVALSVFGTVLAWPGGEGNGTEQADTRREAPDGSPAASG